MRWQLLTVTILMLLAMAANAPAQLQFVQTTIDAGTVYTGQPLVRRFEFVNVAKNAVDIVEAKASCACAKPRLGQKTLQPGEKGWVDVEVHTLGQAPGANVWSVWLVCASGSMVIESASILQIKANLISEVWIEPAALQLLTSQALAAELALNSRKPFIIQSLATSSPHLQVEVCAAESVKAAAFTAPPGAAPGSLNHKLRVQVSDDYPEGRHEEIVSIYTDDPTYRELRVPVTVVKTSKQRVSATPESLIFSAVGGQAASRIVLLRSGDNRPVQIAKVAADDAAVSCTWAAGPGNMTTIKVRLDAKALRPEGLRSVIHVEINQPMQQSLTIPLECRLDKEK
jgi:hypothetical protein